MTTVTLSRTGNTEAVAVPKSIRESRGFKPDDRFKVTSPDDDTVVIRRVRNEEERSLDRMMATLEWLGASRPGSAAVDDLLSDISETLSGRENEW